MRPILDPACAPRRADAAAAPGESPPPAALYRCTARHALLALGALCVALGVIGVVVPGLPTTPFLLAALWAFSKSSVRFHLWLWNHPRLGPPLRDWHGHRVIRPRAKAAALATMGASLAVLLFGVAESWILPAAAFACMAPPAAFILTRPGRPPG